jgi:predicted RNase H-like HicB family nuclease
MKHSAKDYEVRIWYSSAHGDDCYIAQVNDMPGVMAHGDSREAAAREIQEALKLALDTYAENNELPPPPKSSAAVALGQIGGSVKSSKKSLAARLNGKKGGRPKKSARKLAVGG